MSEQTVIRRKSVILSFVVLCACIVLLIAGLFLLNTRMKKIDVTGCLAADSSFSYSIDTLAGGRKMKITGWLIDGQVRDDAHVTTVVLRQEETGEYFSLPTIPAARPDLNGTMEIPDSQVQLAGFQSSAFRLTSKGPYHLYLLYEAGENRYLIDTQQIF